MAKDNIIGLAMGLDVTDLKAGINQVKKLVKQSKDEFNLATAGLDKWTQSADGLTAKVTQLNKQLDAQKKSVAGYKAEIDRVSKLEGDHSVQLERLKEKLNQAEIAVKKTETQISKYSNSLAEINTENKKAESSFGKLTSEIEEQKAELSELEFAYKDAVTTYGKNSKEAKSLAKQITSLNSDLQKNQKEVKHADKQLELLEKQFDDTEDEAKDFGSALDNIKGLGSFVGKGIATIGASVAGLATAFFATGESTKEFRTNMGKVETAFEVAGLKAEEATETYKNLYAVVADEGKATEATAHIAKLAKSQEDLSKWTNICTGVYATFGDSLPIENLTEASNETAKTGKITGGLADALNWAGVSEEKFQEALDKCTNEQQRNKLITETLNGLYTEASKKYQQTNKDVIESNKSQANLTATMAEFGKQAEPILNVVKEGFGKILQAVLDLMKGVDFEALKASIENAFAYFIDTIIPAIVDGFQWIMDNKDTLIAGIVGIGTAMLAWNVVSIITGVVKSIKAWTVATEGLTLAQKLLNLVMKANPIGIVITLITSLIAVFITLWNTSDKFRNFWINLWEKIKKVTSKAIDAIKKWFSNLWSDVKKIWGQTVDWFKNIGSKIASGFQKALNSTKNFFSNAWKSIKKAWSSVISWFKNIGTKISDNFKKATNKVKDFFSKTWTNIKKVWSSVTNWFKNIASKVVNAFKSIPSRIKNFFSTAWSNIKKIWSGVTGWFQNIKEKIIGAFKSVPSRIKTFFSNAWSNVKSAWSNPTKFFSNIKNEIVNAFKEIPSKMLSVGKDIVKGLWNGINDMGSWIGKKIKGFGDGVLQGVKDFFGIKSPSRVFRKIGQFLSEGLGIGILDGKEDVTQAGIETGEAYKDGLLDVTGKTADEIIDTFNNVSDEVSNIELSPDVEEQSYWDKFVDECGKALGLTGKQLDSWSNEVKTKVGKLGSAFSEIGSTIGNVASQMFDVINDAIDQQISALDNELEIYNKNKDEELEKQEELYKKGLISEKELAKTQDKIAKDKQKKEEEILKQKNKLAKKQFKAEQANNVGMALINGAQAILKGFADLGPIGGAINAVAQGILTGVQIATINKQEYVPMLAKGGIVNSPTLAMIGEAGKEAVMPLENNTGWINELAYKLNSIMQRDYISGVNGQVVSSSQFTNNNNNYNYTQNIIAPKTPSRREIYRDTKNLLALKGV